PRPAYRSCSTPFIPLTNTLCLSTFSSFFFFFQAEDGIRDGHVTGVQTCALPILVHDTARSTMYANEIAEIRKMAKITLRSELALEQVGLRLETIQEFGDVAATMGPIAGVVAAIKNQVQGVIPQVGYELGEISESL